MEKLIAIVKPPVYPRDLLQGIFNLQKGLLNSYIIIEGMPQYPLNLDLREHQTLMKDFIGRGIEELSEAYEVHLALFHSLSNNETANGIPLLVSYNEELSDALHFFVEAMVFGGLGVSHLNRYYGKLYLDMGLPLPYGPESNTHTLQMLFDCCNQSFGMDANLEMYAKRNGIPFTVNSEPNYGGSVSPSSLANEAQLMWTITHEFKQACNCLKKRKWRIEDEEVDTHIFEDRMLKAFGSMIYLLNYLGHDAKSTYEIYYHKNIINQKRIEQKR